MLAFLIMLFTAHAGPAAVQPQTQHHKPKPYHGLTVVCSQGQNADGSFWKKCVG